MWSCFEYLVIRKIIVQSKFNLNAQFKIYRFFIINSPLHVDDVIKLSSICMHLLLCFCFDEVLFVAQFIGPKSPSSMFRLFRQWFANPSPLATANCSRGVRRRAEVETEPPPSGFFVRSFGPSDQTAFNGP